ncbi:MAG: acetylglutamate kinase, partial [Planctomycetes bacterium]|nr:acetylglutamate kinase [Planctomycetota bacterium]
IDEIGNELKEIMRTIGAKAELLNGRDQGFLQAEKKTLPQYPEVDLQCVGEPVGIKAEQVNQLLADKIVPLVAPVAVAADGSGTHYNINGDTASAFIAGELHAAKLVFLSDTMGILQDEKKPDSIYSSLKKGEVESLIAQGIISGGMIPKVEACIHGISAGIGKAHIVSGYQPHALLLEIFTKRGVGTEIVH